MSQLMSSRRTKVVALRAGSDNDSPEEDKDSPVPGLTHRYPDRVLMVTTHVSVMYCRFCKA